MMRLQSATKIIYYFIGKIKCCSDRRVQPEESFFVFQDAVNDARVIHVFPSRFSCMDKYLQTD